MWLHIGKDTLCWKSEIIFKKAVGGKMHLKLKSDLIVRKEPLDKMPIMLKVTLY